MPQLLDKWAHTTKACTTPLEGPCYYACFACGHKGPAVDCTGRTSEDARQDRALNAEMKRLWNTQTPNGVGNPAGALARQSGELKANEG